MTLSNQKKYITRKRFSAFCTSIALLCVATASAGEPSHAISYFGDLKYPKDFPHFDYVNPDAPKGGLLHESPVPGTFNNLHAYVDKGVAAIYVNAKSVTFTQDRLMSKSEDELASYYCLLAESVEVADDFSWVNYTLRENARWHDGQPVTVEDALWTFKTVKDGPSLYWKNIYRDFASMEQTGPRSFKLIFTEESEKGIQLAIQTTSYLIQPKHYWTETDAQGNPVRNFAETTLDPPLGNGPYKITEVDPGHNFILERVEDYWGKDLNVRVGQHNFDKIKVMYFFDLGVMRLALKAGVVDYFREQDEKMVATAYDFPALHKGLFKKETYTMGMPYGMHQSIVFNTRLDKFKDIRVREALTLAYNFEWANRVFWYGGHKRNNSFFMGTGMSARGLPSEAELEILEPFRDQIPPRVFTHPVDLPVNDEYGRNRDTLLQADKLLREAGWVVRDFKRVHEETGEQFTIEFMVMAQTMERILIPYADNLARLGIDAKIRRVEANILTNRLRTYDFESCVRKYYQFRLPIPSLLRNQFLSDFVDMPNPASGNFAGVENPVVDHLIEKIISARSEEELAMTGRALDRVLLWNFYVIPEGYPKGRHLMYWARLGHPPLGAEYMSWTGYPHLWWYDEEGAARIEAGNAELKDE